MRKSLILIATAIGGGASYAAAATEAAAGPSADDPSTWRWRVSSILAPRVENVADAFNQRYERYTPSGLPKMRDSSR